MDEISKAISELGIPVVTALGAGYVDLGTNGGFRDDDNTSYR